MKKAKGAPSCMKCTYYKTCDDKKKSSDYYCECYELGMEEKVSHAWCSTCKQYLPVSAFRKNSGRSNGLASSCKSCERKRENSASGRYRSYKKNARQRGISFNITKDDFYSMIYKRCNYCGEYGHPFVGVDRIDNNSGYTVDNCVPCCEWCNKIKINHTVDEMKEHIEKMIKYMADGNETPAERKYHGKHRQEV